MVVLLILEMNRLDLQVLVVDNLQYSKPVLHGIMFFSLLVLVVDLDIQRMPMVEMVET